ncbi:MAG: nuclear transport factor 2 family protein [Ignavibacteriaceae bacterium]|nr:nuclear transport factor 2 family protein [Ignavibacteriaceae bacterium]
MPSILVLVILIFSCSENLTQLTQRYPTVYNTHNVNDIVNLYADDAVFEVAGQFALNGRDQIRDITKYDSVLNIKMSISNIEAVGDSVFCNLSETNDWLQIAEIGEAHYSVIFVFKDGLISKINAAANPETAKAFSNVLTPLLIWARENKSDLLTEMMPGGKFIYNAENAMKTLNLLIEWKESTR